MRRLILIAVIFLGVISQAIAAPITVKFYDPSGTAQVNLSCHDSENKVQHLILQNNGSGALANESKCRVDLDLKDNFMTTKGSTTYQFKELIGKRSYYKIVVTKVVKSHDLDQYEFTINPVIQVIDNP